MTHPIGISAEDRRLADWDCRCKVCFPRIIAALGRAHAACDAQAEQKAVDVWTVRKALAEAHSVIPDDVRLGDVWEPLARAAIIACGLTAKEPTAAEK